MIKIDKPIKEDLVKVLNDTLNVHDQNDIWLKTGVSQAALKKIRYGDAYLTRYTYEAAIYMINYAITKLKKTIKRSEKTINFLESCIPGDRIYETDVKFYDKYKRN